jgi:hypothetical protein
MTDKDLKWHRVLLAKAQLVSELPAFLGIKRIINMFIQASAGPNPESN